MPANIWTKIEVKLDVEMMGMNQMKIMEIPKGHQMIRMSLKMKKMKKRKQKMIQNQMMKILNTIF